MGINMKKKLRVFWGIMAMLGVCMVMYTAVCEKLPKKAGYAAALYVPVQAAARLADIVGLRTAGKREFEVEEQIMQIVYQLARRSIVKVVVKDAAGSGVVWNIEGGIVIASNRHLLMKDVTAEIVFGNGETVFADVIGYSKQYDIGFVRIPESAVTGSVLRDIYEVVPILYETSSEEARMAFASLFAGQRIMQVGAVTSQKTCNLSVGDVIGLKYMPLFQTDVLETACFSRAGMSGGGVFDAQGHFLGMISGGEVAEDAELREAQITYSIPPALIASEYAEIIRRER